MPDHREQARAELRTLYAALARDLAARPELFCQQSGRCCRFREAGHELFLTRLEFEEMVERGGARTGAGDVCPWLEEGLCGNRDGRALACRTYFCSNEPLAAAVTERWHRRVRALHDRHGLAYHYGPLAGHLNPEGTNSSKEP